MTFVCPAFLVSPPVMEDNIWGEKLLQVVWYPGSLYLPQNDGGVEASAVLFHHSLHHNDCSRDGHMTTSGLTRGFGVELIGYWKERDSILLTLRTISTWEQEDLPVLSYRETHLRIKLKEKGALPRKVDLVNSEEKCLSAIN